MKRLMVLIGAVLASLPAWAGELQPLRAAEVAKLYATAHERPLAVEIWSLDCGYCRENAAHLVAWQRGIRTCSSRWSRWTLMTTTAPRSRRRSRT